MRYPITFRISSSLLLALSLSPAGCTRAPSGAPPPAPPTPVSVSHPVERDVTNYADFTGRFEAVYSVEIRARVSGYLDRVYFKDGKEVNEGDLLFEIDPRPYQANLDRTEANLAQSAAHLKRLEADYRRVANLHSRGNASREEFDKSSGDRSEAEAAVGVARADYDLAKLNMKFTKITTPIGGLLSRRMVDPGNLVQADTTPLTTIVSLEPMYLYFDIDERTVLKLRGLVREGKLQSREQGAVAPILAALAGEEGFPHKGVINFSDNKVNPRTGTLRVRGVIENPVVKGKNFRLLSAGLFARVRVAQGESHRALLVTDRAIDTDQGQKILYVVDDKNKVDSRPVRLGAIHDGLRAIEDGLKPGERVIVVGLQQVRPGAVVEPKLVEMPVSFARRPAGSCLFSHGLQDERCYVSAGSVDGALGWSSSASSCWKMDRPVSHQRVTSDRRLSRVNRSKRVASEANTVRITPRRWAPSAVLLVRAPLRISASRRAFRSLRLLVASTAGCSTNTNRQSGLSINSFCKRMKSATCAGVSSGSIGSPWRVQSWRMRSSSRSTFAARPTLSRPSR